MTSTIGNTPPPLSPLEVLAYRRASDGERLLQERYGTQQRAERFYTDQVRDRLNPQMIEFITRMDMAFISTADQHGECDASLRAGAPGFVLVLDEHTLAYPEYRGNGVMASMGNIVGNPHIGILFVDFVRDLIGLHVNGRARILEPAQMQQLAELPTEELGGRAVSWWVVVEIDEAYIHCRKHIPRMRPAEQNARQWGTDDTRAKGGDYFGTKTSNP